MSELERKVLEIMKAGEFSAGTRVAFFELMLFAGAVDAAINERIAAAIAAANLGVNVTIAPGADCSGLTIKGGDAG